jgi:hypothetical protein
MQKTPISGGERRDFPKLNEQRGNVFENKGVVFHSPVQSGNVLENKGDKPTRRECC